MIPFTLLLHDEFNVLHELPIIEYRLEDGLQANGGALLMDAHLPLEI